MNLPPLPQPELRSYHCSHVRGSWAHGNEGNEAWKSRPRTQGAGGVDGGGNDRPSVLHVIAIWPGLGFPRRERKYRIHGAHESRAESAEKRTSLLEGAIEALPHGLPSSLCNDFLNSSVVSRSTCDISGDLRMCWNCMSSPPTFFPVYYVHSHCTFPEPH